MGGLPDRDVSTANSLPKVDSRAVYATARKIVGPTMKAAGFKREKAYVSWTRPEGIYHLTAWFQVSMDGWDPYAGSKFTVELQLSEDPEVGSAIHRRKRFCELLNDGELETVRQRQNRKIAALPQPPASRLAELGSGPAEYYLGLFVPQPPYTSKDDIWFRYSSESDVAEWCIYIADQVPRVIDRFLAWANQQTRP